MATILQRPLGQAGFDPFGVQETRSNWLDNQTGIPNPQTNADSNHRLPLTPSSNTGGNVDLGDSSQAYQLYDPPVEPLKSILRRHNDEYAPSEHGSVEKEGSIKSISSIEKEQADVSPQGPSPPRTATTLNDVSPLDQDAQQVNFSRPKRTKPGVSRIPVSKSSPLSKTSSPKTTLESPYTLSRKGSIKHARNSLEALELKKNRLSSASIEGSEALKVPDISSQPLPSTAEKQRVSSLTSRDPNKRRSMPDSNTFPRRAGRVTSGQTKPRTISAESNGSVAQRQRANSTPRRSQGPLNRPEGEPPWLATMFKPDPRLPPEQQMLPTHAKRLAMQQGTYVPSADIFEGELLPPVDTASESEPDPVLALHDIPQRSSSIRNPPRRASSKSEPSTENHLTTTRQQQHKKLSREDQTQGTDWPLRTPSPKPDTENVFTESFNPQDTAVRHETPIDAERNERMSSDPTLAQSRPSTAAPSTKPPELISQPAPAPTIPQIPLAKVPEKDRSCGCCAVM